MADPNDVKINVLLVNEIRLMCNVLAASLEDEPDIQIFGCATNVQEALTILQTNPIDVVLVSSKLPQQGAMWLTQAISDYAPATKTLILGLTEQRERILRYVEAGATGYVLKDDSLDNLIANIRAAQKEKALISPEIAAAMMDRLSSLAQLFAEIENSVTEDAGLTNRELEVLELIGKDFTNQQIADQLFIEVGTVKNHVHNILEKLNVSSRGEAAAYLAFIRE